ncbi:hypothetical protein [Corynebacterium efficiens YS-314]|uniref:Uncharacterized protein n=1 Tax=Corynebacterium efficiens (strain DSM 44549 / YS-314 / AJ 12310 / JCM 11189 / NBRC 100395) TaxID=196164 RepID=Q8FTS2_COREF|nr:hypothetical protein [Corynebacterium efficiens YS-314]
MEQPDKDVIWGSPLPEILGGARSRYQLITEGPSADPGLENSKIRVNSCHRWCFKREISIRDYCSPSPFERGGVKVRRKYQRKPHR